MKTTKSRARRCVSIPTYLVLFTLLITSIADGATRRYRLSWRDDPTTTMVIGWEQNGGSNPLVYYGTVDHGTNWSQYPNSHAPDRTSSAKGMTHHFARLTGLQPDTAYYFVVRDSSGTSNRMWFKTAPNTPQNFSVVGGGDSRNNRTPRQNANIIVSKLRPLFIAFGGDYTDANSNSQWQTWLDDWQLIISSDGRIYPIVATRGNHEDNSTVEAIFDTPNTNVYYSLEFGGNQLKTFTLNSEISAGGSQRTWLVNELAASTGFTYRMAQYHKPMRPHTSGKSEGNDEYNNWAQPFYDYGMDLVVECDSHMTKRTWPVRPSTGGGSDEGFIRDDATGTVYIGEGCWGAPLRTANDSKNWTRALGSFNQVQWVHVRTDKVEVRTIDTGNASSVGSVSDSNPLQIPSNLNVWNPSGGAVIEIFPLSDVTAPQIADVTAPTTTTVEVEFNEQVDSATAQNASHYSINNGISISSATLLSGNTTVRLNTSTLQQGTTYTVTVNNVEDVSGNVIASNSQDTFEYLNQQTLVFEQNVGGYTGTVDTVLEQNSPTANNANDTSMSIDLDDPSGSGNDNQGLIRFDNIIGGGAGQIPAGSTIISATIELNTSNPGDGANFHRMLQSWAESANWNTFGSGIQANNAEAVSSADLVTGSVSTGTATFDVTPSLVAWVESGAANHGWVLLGNGNNGWDFSTSEGASPPILTVTFAAGNPPVNNPPSFSSDPIVKSNGLENTGYSASIAGDATDPDPSDTLSFSKLSGPSWLSVAANGALSGTPGSGDVGLNQFSVEVNDGNGGSDTATLEITVDAQGGGSGAFQQDSGTNNLVSMEAESFDSNTAQGSHSWNSTTSFSGFSGTMALEAAPNQGTNNNTGYTTASPRLNFQVNFVQSGTHYVWVRGYSRGGSDDSCHAGVNGQANTTADRISNFTTNTYAWSSTTMDSSARATINVPSTGEQTINIWMREDGFIVDKIVLTTSSSYTPSGTGPAESPRGGGGGPTLPAINLAAASNVTTDLADINYDITDDGGETPTVTLYWGETDGGQVSGSWDFSTSVGSLGIGSYTTPITGLNSDTTYFYNGSASNSAGTDWGSPSQSFTTQAGGGSDPIQLNKGVVTGVGNSWQQVTLPESYHSMVVVCTVNIASTGNLPVVPRVRNASGNSFEVRVQNPSDSAVSGYTVHYIVVEEGVYTTAAHGVKMEAVKFTSTVTDAKNGWVAQSRSYTNSYTNPVVVGQVMTANDPDWSVFWAQGSSRTAPPSGSALKVGKHVGEDTDKTRANETLGYIVIEDGTGTISGQTYEAGVGSDTIRGIGNTPPFSYTSAITPSAAVLSPAAMDGGDGGWPNLYGTNPLSGSQINMVFDEDQISDAERSHTTEQVAFFVVQ